MSKKQIMKNIQKDRKDSKSINEKDNYFKFVTTVAILLLVFILSYFLMGLFYTKEIDLSKKDKDSTDQINVDNETIMLGQLFDQPDSEYYVLIYNPDDKVSSITSWLPIYEAKEGANKVYKVDSTKKFNSSYIVTDGSNQSPTSLSDLKVKSPTLIKISNKVVSEYIEGEDAIVNKLKND